MLTAQEETYERIEVGTIQGLFSNARIDYRTVPPTLFKYDIRGSDNDPGALVYAERSVLVNHAGTLIMASQLPLVDDIYMDIREELNFFGDHMTLQEFIEERANE